MKRVFKKSSKLKQLLGEEKAQATVELALILPLILLLVMIIIYVGMFTFSKSVVLLSTHEGAREGILIWNTPELSQEEKEEKIRSQVEHALENLPNGTDSTISIQDDQNGLIRVDTTYYFKLNLPFLKDITGYDAVPIKSEVVYRYTRTPTQGD